MTVYLTEGRPLWKFLSGALSSVFGRLPCWQGWSLTLLTFNVGVSVRTRIRRVASMVEAL